MNLSLKINEYFRIPDTYRTIIINWFSLRIKNMTDTGLLLHKIENLKYQVKYLIYSYFVIEWFMWHFYRFVSTVPPSILRNLDSHYVAYLYSNELLVWKRWNGIPSSKIMEYTETNYRAIEISILNDFYPRPVIIKIRSFCFDIKTSNYLLVTDYYQRS